MVISIIALLVSVLMPALNKAKRQAKAVICLSNLHQWGLVFAEYTGDNNNYFMAGNSGGDEDEPVTWLCVLRPYYKDLNLLRCPMASKPSVPEPVGEEPPGKTFFACGVFDGSRWQYPGDYGSYGINAWCYNPVEELSYGDQAGLDHLLWRSTNFKGTGNAPLLLDSIWIGGWPQHSDDPPPAPGWSPHIAKSNMA